MIFADLDAAVAASISGGAEIRRRTFRGPTGRGARIRYADGPLVEYLEHHPSPDDVDRSGGPSQSRIRCRDGGLPLALATGPRTKTTGSA